MTLIRQTIDPGHPLAMKGSLEIIMLGRRKVHVVVAVTVPLSGEKNRSNGRSNGRSSSRPVRIAIGVQFIGHLFVGVAIVPTELLPVLVVPVLGYVLDAGDVAGQAVEGMEDHHVEALERGGE